MRSRSKVLSVMVGTVLVVGMGASSAMALDSTHTGAYVWDSNSRHTLNVKDTADDGRWVAGNWESNLGSGGGVGNYNGVNTTVSQLVTSAPEQISALRACRNRVVGPMECEAWSRY